MTPEWVAQELVEQYFSDLNLSDLVLEPACGTGAFLKALPPGIRAVGVEIDPELAAQCETNTGYPVLVGDFRRVDLSGWKPTVILGNPPFQVSLIEAFLVRAARLLPDDGRCGFILPAYAMQTHRRVWRWHQAWSIAAEILPRRLFPELRLPILFVQFRKERARTLVGFALFREAVEFDNLAAPAKLILVQGRSRKGVWRAVVEAMLETMGGQASLKALYQAIEPSRPTPNPWWKERVRATLQAHFVPIKRGVWALG